MPALRPAAGLLYYWAMKSGPGRMSNVGSPRHSKGPVRTTAFPRLLVDPRRKRRTAHTLWWITIALLIPALDYAIGPVIQFPMLFVVPVSLAVWWTGRWAGVLLALALPLLRLYFATVHTPPWTLAESTVNAGIRVFVLLLVVVFVDAVWHSLALAREMQVLRGFLPICSFCRKIKDQRNVWHSIEKYISEGTSPEFSPSVCPDCQRRPLRSPGRSRRGGRNTIMLAFR